MKLTLSAVFITAILDAMGIALTLPIMPSLLRDVGMDGTTGWALGVFIAVYPLMQFLTAPLMGSLSDRYGRRPILLMSLAAQMLSYTFLVFAPSYELLLLARAVAGIAGASTAVVSAVIVDVTPDTQRARRFGQLGACIGVGYILGPTMGGILGGYWVRLPFVAAAGLALANLLWTAWVLRETKPASEEREATPLLNPLAALRWAGQFPSLSPLLIVFALITLVGEIAGTIWVVYGEDTFAWSAVTVGISLTCFGLFHALAQAFLAGPLVSRFGEKRVLILGILADSCAFFLIAMATSGWVAFALTPLFCMGGLAGPAIQSLISSAVSDQQQGRLQGLMGAITGLVTVIAPVLASTTYFATRSSQPGTVWVVGAGLYLAGLVIFAVVGPRADDRKRQSARYDQHQNEIPSP
ncbi:TCR/Tet family MFS transporter [Pseudomonas sp. NPDC086278]|uniref:TCR/Tet family MFS transporter n=1 Tax=Pseudomonas sp. NPDC086278 TaxID=3390646 RepID=UPI003D0171D6